MTIKKTNIKKKKCNNNVSFLALKNEFINQTIIIEQDDIPTKLLELRTKFKMDIDKLCPRDRNFIMEDDNFF